MRSVSEVSALITPRSSLLSTNLAVRSARASLGTLPLPAQRTRPSCIFAFFDSGMCPAVLFLAAMIFYCSAVQPANCYDYHYAYYTSHGKDYHGTCLKPWRRGAWEYLAGALLFVVESLFDLVWGILKKFSEHRLQTLHKEIWQSGRQTSAAVPRPTDITALSRPSGNPLRPSDTISETRQVCCPSFDRVWWDILAALFFLIPACFYVAASLIDPYGVYWPWIVIGPMDTADYSALMCKIAGAGFVFDAVLALCGRWSIRRQVPPHDRLALFCPPRGFFTMDWGCWGDFFFLIGALVEGYSQFYGYGIGLEWVTEILWTLDALFYIFQAWPSMRAIMYGDDRETCGLACN